MIAMTPAAQDQLTEILNAQTTTDNKVRVSVARGPHGCVHGWSFNIEHQPQPDDVIYAVGPLQVVIEPDLIETLEGATIDYRVNYGAIGFTINAPISPDHGEHQGCHHN